MSVEDSQATPLDGLQGVPHQWAAALGDGGDILAFGKPGFSSTICKQNFYPRPCRRTLPFSSLQEVHT